MSPIWKYSGGHDKYPVAAGQIWRVGNHLFLCGDLESDSLLDNALRTQTPSLIYVDPPWNNGNGRSFRTKAGVDGEQGRAVDIATLIRLAIKPAADNHLLAFVEGGRKESAMVSKIIEDMGGVVGHIWNITYYGEKPCVVFAADFRSSPINDYPNLEGMDDELTPYAVLNHYKPELVLDTCAGRGLTARSAERLGLKSITHELSPYRMAEAIQSVVALTGLKAEIV